MSSRSKRQKKAVNSRKHFIIAPISLEFTKVVDGFLRGEPEVAVLIGVYRTKPTGASLTTRLAIRRRVTEAPPCVLELEEPERDYRARLDPDERLLVVALAVEEDSGDGLRALYGSLERPTSLQLWMASEPVPSVRSLQSWCADGVLPPQAAKVEILVDGRPPAELASGDDYVSACAFAIHPSGERYDDVWRLGFEDEAQTYQFTATVNVKVRG